MTYDALAGREGDVLAVVSQSGPTVSFFDAASHRLLDVLEVLAEPHELCLDPARRLLWCTHSYHGGYYHANNGRRSEITLIDPDERRIVDVIDLAPEHAPHGLALDSTRDLLYVSVEGAQDRPGGVVVVDLATRKPIGRIDTGGQGAALVRHQPGRQRRLCQQQGGAVRVGGGPAHRHDDGQGGGARQRGTGRLR
ncbi:YncE family protein [Nonomuraea indica]|uniref:YncE family protein n=1 Tax=Nonomuraea indica TaxID=1581193 RepID=UPI001C5EAF1A|nr:hypothetical protein [Nonomuraea indica]